MAQQFQKIKDFVIKKKKIFISAIIILAVASFFVFGGKKDTAFNTDTVKYQDLAKIVKASGIVVSHTDLNLSFNKASIVKSVRVKVGDKVWTGEVLATLDQGQALSTLTKAKAELLAAEAKYQKILDGSRSEEITLAETALGNAKLDYDRTKSRQDILVAEAFDKFSSSKQNGDYKAYDLALKTRDSELGSAQAVIDQRQAELAVKKAAATKSELDLAQADILSAQGSLQGAESGYEDTIIRAPAPGTVTKVDIKYGELSEVGKSVIAIEDVGNLYVEALINEANIVNLVLGQKVDVDFDAFGKDNNYTGKITEIDPGADTEDGVVNYKIKISLDQKDPKIRPGMNTNIIVRVGEIKNVLSVPKVSIEQINDKSFVNVRTDKGKLEEREVETGFVGDNNLIEIKSGLHEGETVVFPK